MTTSPDIHAKAHALAKAAADRGKLIELGWIGLSKMYLHPNTPPAQAAEMRACFFGGAHHIFSSILSLLDPEREPTDGDYSVMASIETELKEFIAQFEKDIPTKGNA